MKREELEELHYITLIANAPSIMEHGLLSNKAAKAVDHESCASQEIQQRRSNVIVPGGRPLHDFANLYINARNPMMHLLKERHRDLTVIAVSPAVLDLPGVIISDRNASRDYALFKSAPDGLVMIDRDFIFSEFWTHPDPIKQYEHKGIMCAEVLVPDKIDAKYILKAYVSCCESQEALSQVLSDVPSGFEIALAGRLFFL